MRPTPENPTLASWRELGERLAGYFAAHSRGLLSSEFALSGRSGEAFGRLRVHGLGGAQLEVGSTRAEIKRTARYRMLTRGVQTLVADPVRGTSALEVRCGSRTYGARLDLMRNTAVALSPSKKEAAHINGGLTNRSYEAVFDAEDEGSLPVAVFLLYHTVALRRRVFLAGARASNS
jgi:hypothetical protein